MALAHNIKNYFLGPKETAPEVTKDSALTPEFYFSAERVAGIAGSIGKLSSISVNNVTYSDNKKGGESELKIEFKRDGKLFEATFTIEREQTGSTYRMTAEVYSERGKEIFRKERNNMNYMEIEGAVTYVFHQAFSEE